MQKFLKIKFVELQKLISATKYTSPFSPLIKFWALNLLVYSLIYPLLKIIAGKKKSVKICEYFIKPPASAKTLSFPSLIKSRIILKTNEDWAVFIEMHLKDAYHKDAIKKGMTVVDIGAHIGVYSILAAEKVGDAGKVIAVEPELNNYKRLKKNIRLNGFKNIIPLKIALSERDGTGKLYINPCSTDHSLLTENNENFSFTQVQIRTLDKLLEELNIKKIDIIKIDTEGAEMPILRGAEKTLKNNPKAKMIVASYHYPREIEEVQSFLEKRGFKTEILYSDIIITI